MSRGPGRRQASIAVGASVLVASVLVLIGALTGCGADRTAGTGGDGASPGTGGTGPAGSTVTGVVTVSAAASLTEPFRAIGAEFSAANPGAEVRFNFDASSSLARQVVDGAPVDVFASADEANATKVVDAGKAVAAPRPFAHSRLAIAVKPGNPAGIGSLADLPAAGTVALCAADAPCGTYAAEVLARAGVALSVDRVTRAPNAKATVGAVANGDADAAIVYVTDATGAKVDTVAIPDAANVEVVYPLVVVRGSANPTAAEAFAAFVLGPTGQARLRQAGFTSP